MRPQAVLAACLLAALASADEVVLKNGSSFEGRITEETDSSVSIDVGAGVMKFDKSDVAHVRRDQQPPSGEAAGTSVSPADAPQGLEGALVATVGPGGVTRKQFEDYIYNSLRGTLPEELTPAERRAALDRMIDRELFFQGALADGMLEDADVRKRLCLAHLSKQGVDVGAGSAASIPEEELRAWYDAHKEDLVEAKRLYVRGARLLNLSTAEGNPGLVDGKYSEDEYDRWIRKLEAAAPNDPIWAVEGWVSESEPLMGPQTFSMLKTTRKGGFSNDILCSDNWLWVFRVDVREDASEPPRFEACRERVRLYAWADKRKRAEEQVDDDVLRAAVEAGLHRDSYHREFIIQAYVARKGGSAEALLAELRERFRVTVLLDE